MPVQTSVNNSIGTFLLNSDNLIQDSKQIIKREIGRVDPLLSQTLMAQVQTPGAEQYKWVPWISAVATEDGTAIPFGVYVGADIAATDLDAADIPDSLIWLADFEYDKDLLVLDRQGTNGQSLDDLVKATTAVDNVVALTARNWLRIKGIYGRETREITNSSGV